MSTNYLKVERTDTIVIGAGQAGLSVGYHLARQRIPFIILEANDRVGDTWRKRWESLRLFTPAWLDSLPGMAFPAPSRSFPTKDDMANYLSAYAERFNLPVRTGVRVNRLWRSGDRYLIDAGDVRYEARHVVVAMANYQEPRVPDFAAQLAPEIVQLHSKEYSKPSQLRAGKVLVVGAGNSGAEIAMELVTAGHPTWLAGRDTGQIPFQIDSLLGKYVFAPLLLRFVFHRLLTLDTPMGRKAHAKATASTMATPLIRRKPKDLLKAGVVRVPKVIGVRGGLPVLENGETLDVENVIWCTGFHAGFKWIDLPVFDLRGRPQHERGIVRDEPGLFFVGLHFLYALSSTMIQGVGRDANRIADAIVNNRPAQRASQTKAIKMAKAG
ncbi:MAG: NAD(P)-binding domain-containing protein [bacterium]